MKDEEIENKSEEIENCRNYLSQFNDSQRAYEVINSFFNESSNKNSIHIGTIHGAKGLEWDTVIIMGCEDDKMPHALTTSVLEIEEERRIAYVGITRPKTNLFLTWVEKRDGLEKLPSPFLNELQDYQPSMKKVSEDRVSKYASIMENWDREARERREKLAKVRKLEDQKEKRRIAEVIAENRKAINRAIADGKGQGGGWNINDTGNGFLLEVGYSAIKDGPSEKTRHDILSKVFNGAIDMPNTLKTEVAKTWGEPNTIERLKKMKNTINIALGAQESKNKFLSSGN